MNAEDRIKLRSYDNEREALKSFIEGDVSGLSPHVVNAVRYRARIVEREIKIIKLG